MDRNFFRLRGKGVVHSGGRLVLFQKDKKEEVLRSKNYDQHVHGVAPLEESFLVQRCVSVDFLLLHVDVCVELQEIEYWLGLFMIEVLVFLFGEGQAQGVPGKKLVTNDVA